jgi:hypothetical protein
VARRGRFTLAGLLLSGILIWTGLARTQTGPSISSLPPIIYVGDNFVIGGSGFTSSSVINFFVATPNGPQNFGPLEPAAFLSDSLTVPVPVSVAQGEGVASIAVVNTDEGHSQSNAVLALLQGDASAGLPSLTQINGVGLSPTSTDPGVALANVETVVSPGATITLTGSGFDTVNGVGVDLFCDCPGGKVGPFFLTSGGLSADNLTFTLPSGSAGPNTGPGAFRVVNLGNLSVSAAVSVPIGAQIALSSVTQTGSTVVVTGAGFCDLTVINFFNLQAGSVVNLGGLNPDGTAIIPISLINNREMEFSLPAGTMAGPAYVQAVNPPFIPFTSSGNSPGGAFLVH